MSETTTVHLLNQSAGYGVLVGVGGGFAIGMVLVTILLRKYLKEDNNSTETFSVANRSVGTLLSASAVYSSWSWATELLWCTTMVYNYGIQSSYYYMSGLAVQIAVMSMVGIHAKKKIPQAHTSLEIIELRYGKASHILYMFLGLSNNLLSCSSMILGASGAISIIAGNLHIVAATILTIFSVLCYSVYGGLKATFLTDFVHTMILLIILCYLNTSVLSNIGGLDALYDALVAFDNSGTREIPGNYANSVITGKSKGSIIFGLILTAGNFGLSVMDSSFWQKTFSASPRATVPAYLTAAFLIVSNVWPLGAIIGGAAIVLEKSPKFPTYPRAMTQFEIDSGFALPYALMATVGKGAVGALLLIVYLAVTSTVSAQMISVSSILSFDIYKKYINPNAQNKSMITVSHVGCIVFTLGAAGFTIMLHYVGINMTWYGYFYPLIICPGVIPLILSITWSKQNVYAAFISPILGIVFGFIVWTTTAYKFYGSVNIESLGGQLPALYGALTALFLPGIASLIISFAFPHEFDWGVLQKAHLLVKDTPNDNDSTNESSSEELRDEKSKQDEVGVTVESDQNSSNLETQTTLGNSNQQLTTKQLNFWIKVATGASIFILLIMWVLWPLPLYRDWIFSRAYFKGYVTVGNSRYRYQIESDSFASKQNLLHLGKFKKIFMLNFTSTANSSPQKANTSSSSSSSLLNTSSMNYHHQQDSRKRQSKRDDAIRRRIEHDLNKKKRSGGRITRHRKSTPGTVLSLKPSDPIICKTSATVYEVSQLMTAKRENCVLVVDDIGDLLGIFTAKDLAFRIVGSGVNANSVTIDQIMTPDPICATANNPASEALTMMVEKGFRHLPVLDEDHQIVGVLDITKCYAQQMEKLERMHASSKKLYEALDSVHTEIGMGDQPPSQVFHYFEILKNKINGPTLDNVLDETTEPIYISVKASVYDATVLMKQNRTTAVLVKDTNEEVAGIFTSKDVVLRVIAAGLDPKKCSVVRVMTPQPDVANVKLPIQQALRQMFEGHYLNLPIVNEDGKIIGIVDVLKLTYATLNQIKQLEAKEFPVIADGSQNLQDSEGPAWNKFWTSLGHEDSESAHSGSFMESGCAASASASADASMNASVNASAHRFAQPELQAFNVDIKPSDSVSHVELTPIKGSLVGGSAASGYNNSLATPFVFKFKSPAIEGRVHRITLTANDGAEKLRSLIDAKLHDKDYEAIGVCKSVPPVETNDIGAGASTEIYAISYVDDEGDVVSITSDNDLSECVRINLKLGNEKADLYLHNPHERAPVENIKLITKKKKKSQESNSFIPGVSNEILIPSVLAILASSIIIGFTMSRK
ncbi:hypothetical protein KGF56_004188 [Candida oxycetoniae]|uniref:Uncharacterized protein n=1 Tax=Candida oxycetoniae TaxID=497107 RepID=A0AAI9SU62_9ASCO|nr:uncharacterized protein KGF56_004188 [Candida oxycetoniae]KAI3402936.2 hypothetical protein KGF56_004188 [Candida oxycetoniae]